MAVSGDRSSFHRSKLRASSSSSSSGGRGSGRGNGNDESSKIDEGGDENEDEDEALIDAHSSSTSALQPYDDEDDEFIPLVVSGIGAPMLSPSFQFTAGRRENHE